MTRGPKYATNYKQTIEVVNRKVRRDDVEEKVLVIRIKGHKECLKKIKELKEELEQLNKLMRESVELRKLLGL